MAGLPAPPAPAADHALWWEPEPLGPSVSRESGESGAAGPLSDEQVQRWLSDGFLALDNIWPTDLIARAAVEAYQYFPLPHQREEGDNGSELSGSVARRDSQGRLWPNHVNTSPSSARQVAMPFFDLDDVAGSPDLAINQIALHSRILSIASQLLDTTEDDLRCDLNVIRCRYGVGLEDGNQDMHVGAPNLALRSSLSLADGPSLSRPDYGNLSMVVPPRNPRPDAFILILYYTDVEETGGPTHLAKPAPGELTSYDKSFNPPNGQPGRSPSLLRRLYETERPIRYSPGTCALYRLDSWHRGTPPLPGKHRAAHHIAYRRAGSEWISWQAYTQPMSAMPSRFLESLSPLQRGVLGFPSPGDPYWTADTVDAVGQRYAGMDMAPYEAALALSKL